MIPHLTLSPTDLIPHLREIPVLPEQSYEIYGNFLPFPVSTADCRPAQFAVHDDRAPRFSIFAGDSVTLNGFRLLECDGHLFTDASLTARDPAHETKSFNRKLQLRQTENIDFSLLGQPERLLPLVERDGPILLPCSDEPANFGSWIYRFLPKLLLSAAHTDFAAVMVYQQPWMTDILRFLGLGVELIRHDPTRPHRVRRPLIPSLAVPYVHFREAARDCMESLHERVSEDAALGELLYISRRRQALHNPRFRTLENETGLVAALSDLGFVEFAPETFSFPQQMAILDKARIIIGCGGSNMFGCIFARHAELILDLESGDDWSNAHANLLASTRSLWSMTRGTQVGRGTPPHLNWTIDIAAVIDGYRKLLDFL